MIDIIFIEALYLLTGRSGRGSMMEKFGNLFIGLSVIAVILAAIGGLFSYDIWLAATQWLIVAAVFGIWAIFFKQS